MRVKIACFFFIVFQLNVLAQQKRIEIEWKDPLILSTSPKDEYKIIGFEGKEFNYDDVNQQIYYSTWIEGVQNFEITNISYQRVNNHLALIDTDQLPETTTLEVVNSSARGDSKTLVQFNLLIKRNGQVQRVTSFELTPLTNRIPTSTFSTEEVPQNLNSKLASGKFYKFIVDQTGIQRIDKKFLSDLGFKPNQINPNTIKIYGHGGQSLPLRNSETPASYFDLPEIPILVNAGINGSFDEGDEILFYAESSVNKFNSTNKSHINPYADEVFYYITVDGGAGKRIPEAQQPPNSANHTISTFQDEQFHEIDEVSLSLVGRRWFGDRFDIVTERSFNFSFPNLVTSEKARIEVAAGAISTQNSSMNIVVDGDFIGNFSMTRIGNNTPSNGSEFTDNNLSLSNDEVSVSLTYNKAGNPAARAHLDYINIQATRNLVATGEQFEFQNEEVALLSGIGEYQLANSSQVDAVWDITNLHEVTRYTNTNNSNNFSFKANLGESKKYRIVDPSDYYSPRIDQSKKEVKNQNLKQSVFRNQVGQTEDIDYLVITHPNLQAQAEDLANFRANFGLKTRVVTTDQIYNEFSSGRQEIAAIRNFIRYIYYNASNEDNRIKYVAILGSTSIDYKDRMEGNNNLVPTYHTLQSFSTTSRGFMSDDFYTMMDPNEGVMANSELMDINIGRILADSPQQAMQMINKIKDYESREAYASWRNDILLVSDDVDESWEFNSIQRELDRLGDSISVKKPEINVRKIHTDAFQQISSAGGDRYPEVNEAITKRVELGVAVMNYFGHGGENGLAQERIVTRDNVENWSNPDRFNIFVTVTCEFTKYDNPLLVSAGELTYLNQNGGPISMITTTRAIFVSDGIRFNKELAPFIYDYNDEFLTIGEAVTRTKNELSTDGKRVVHLLGDPALNLPFARPGIQLTELNGVPLEQATDTLKALSKNKLKGQVILPNNQVNTSFNGALTATIFDKRIDRQTLGNDISNLILDFTTLGETLFRGQASVNQGEFEFEFILPQNTQIPVDSGRISLYALKESETQHHSGYNTDLLIGSIDEDAPEDTQGPMIELFMNDENFVDGGITNNNPFLLAKLNDESGINTAGGIGHDIVAILDEDDENPFILNDYYKSDQDDFTSGTVYFPIRDLEEGLHTLRFRAWDTYNNSSTSEITFMVTSEDEIQLTRVLNYPNPFTDYTEFWFNHNRPFEPLEVMVQVFTVTGKVVWTENQIINTDGFLSRDITWDGRDDFGNRIGKGVYVYKLVVRSTLTNKKAEKYEKLVIL
ncbi:type IX secretion system sortase PorU [Psychroflexus maritimus]|uniref:Type IX secretion system sortase PorU n=1 Tax=Psychroflexus maritimus TaxID=2714865 RepID=A0A967AJ72_9FLAO|nr:type IX secretion system sortase PorU [Psychroflexus maritimus]NGZ89369.1 type IX secretion system sortase PorU [Psychroflexus maritimus]